FEVIYEGIRLTPEQIVSTAVEENPHVVGLSVLSGSHLALVKAVKTGLDAAGMGDTPLVIGGIIPPGDADILRDAGIARIYTPKDFNMNAVMSDILDLVEERLSVH
ncbi:MAG: cobalamin B12-binding domain-containing protein, partial [Rhodospirillales bacterium]|nr:cobalamin B12-binding domain-containing protein [Rhodospirillales bacterium]